MGGGGADARGPRSERERMGRESQRAARAGGKEDGPAWPTRGKWREGREKRPEGGGKERERRGVESWAGPREWAALFDSLSFPFSLL
jgi:hypothetical protein